MDLLVSHSTTNFDVTPNLVILTSCTSEFWGLHKSCSTTFKQIPASMTTAEAAWLMAWMEGAAVTSLATFLGVNTTAVAPTKTLSGTFLEMAEATPPTTNKDALTSTLGGVVADGFGSIVSSLKSGSSTSIGKQLVTSKGLA